MKFYICKHCGNIITKIKDAKVPVMCCGSKMEELIPNTVDAAKEKHVPLFSVDNNKVFVFVGEVEHPMQPEHYIEWIAIETKLGTQLKRLSPSDKPAASFSIGSQDEVVAVFAYCNLHGLWSAENEITTVCDLNPLDASSNENYVVCKCNNVKYFDIIDAAKGNSNLSDMLSVFDKVKNTTRCSTGCGGCYNKVLAIISEMMSGNLR